MYPSPFRQRLRFLGQGIRQFFAEHSALSTLMLINIAAYLLLLIARGGVRVVSYLFNLSLNFDAWANTNLAFPADPTVFVFHPWTVVTSLFVHNGFWHIFFNMFMLYVAGQLFRKYLTSRQLVFTYFLGGIAGNFCFMGAYHLFPVFANAVPYSTCVGASGAIMAILLAVTIYRPNHPLNLIFIGQTTMKWVAVVFVAIDLLSITSGNAGGHFAHLGGAVYGALAGVYFLKGNPFRKVVFIKNERKGYRSSAGSSGRPATDAEFNAKKRQDEKRVDTILDKISESGYGSLTKEERDFLYNYKR